MSDDKPVAETFDGVRLLQPASDALRDLETLTGFSRTDLINRALIIYGRFGEEWSKGNTVLIHERDTGKTFKIEPIEKGK